MATTIPVMARVSLETKEKLRMLARATNRSEAFLAREAIEHFVSLNDWQVSLIEDRLAEAIAGGETVPHDDVAQWLNAKISQPEKVAKSGRP